MVQQKQREPWQFEEWADAMRWYLHWLELARKSGGDDRSRPERVRDAVESAGARRGLALPPRRGYGSWAAWFAATVRRAQEAMDEDRMSEWLGWLVSGTKIDTDLREWVARRDLGQKPALFGLENFRQGWDRQWRVSATTRRGRELARPRGRRSRIHWTRR